MARLPRLNLGRCGILVVAAHAAALCLYVRYVMSPRRLLLCGIWDTCELVVSYCEEDLAWLTPLFLSRFDRVTIYSKCGHSLAPSQPCPAGRDFPVKTCEAGTGGTGRVRVQHIRNVGSCDRAYLHHIVHNYETLLPQIAFVKGTQRSLELWHRYTPGAWNSNPTRSHKWPRALARLQLALGLGAPAPSARVMSQNWSALHDIGPGGWHFTYNQRQRRNATFAFSGYATHAAWLNATAGAPLAEWLYDSAEQSIPAGGFFSTSRAALHRYPVGLYARLMAQQQHPNEEVDHFIERLWPLLLTSAGEPPLASLALPTTTAAGAAPRRGGRRKEPV